MQADKLLRDTHKVFGTHTLRPYKVKNRRAAVSLFRRKTFSNTKFAGAARCIWSYAHARNHFTS